MSDSIEIKILNWEKYNPRSDVKKPSWFRLENSLFDNPDFYEFSHEELCAMIYIFCMASKKNSNGDATIRFSHLCKIGRINRKVFDKTINKLEQLCVIAVIEPETTRGRYVNATDANATERTERDETERNGTEHRNFFDEKQLLDFWTSLGLKKWQGTQLQLQEIEKGVKKFQYSRGELEIAIQNYAQVLSSDSWYNHKFTLGDFIKRGYKKFLNENFVLENFKRRNSSQEKQDNMVRILEEVRDS